MKNRQALYAWIDNGFESPKAGKKPLKRGFIAFATIGIGLLAITACAGLITVFMNLEISVSLDQSAILIDGHNTPYSVVDSFENKSAGESWNVSYVAENLVGNTFIVNLSASSDEGLDVKFQDFGFNDVTQLTIGGHTNQTFYVNYTLNPLCAPGLYNATIEMLPSEVC